MAQEIKIIDGFDDWAEGEAADEGYTGAGTSFDLNIISGRVAGSAMEFKATGTPTVSKIVTADNHPHIAFAFKTNNATHVFNLVEFREGTTVHGRLAYNGNGTFTVSCAGSIPATSANLGIVAGTWYHVELDYYIHDSAGLWELRVDGVSVVGPSTALDTRNAGTSGVCDTIVFSHVSSTTHSIGIDDLVYASGGGVSAGPFFGDCRIITSLPTADGASSQWTPSAGINHYAVVDEATSNDDTDYLSESTSGDRELFTMGALGVTGTVKGVGVRTRVRKTDAGTQSIALTVRSSSINYDHATTHTLSTSYTPKGCRLGHGIWETNPAGGNWTVSSVNAAECGIKVV